MNPQSPKSPQSPKRKPESHGESPPAKKICAKSEEKPVVTLDTTFSLAAVVVGFGDRKYVQVPGAERRSDFKVDDQEYVALLAEHDVFVLKVIGEGRYEVVRKDKLVQNELVGVLVGPKAFYFSGRTLVERDLLSGEEIERDNGDDHRTFWAPKAMTQRDGRLFVFAVSMDGPGRLDVLTIESDEVFSASDAENKGTLFPEGSDIIMPFLMWFDRNLVLLDMVAEKPFVAEFSPNGKIEDSDGARYLDLIENSHKAMIAAVTELCNMAVTWYGWQYPDDN